MKSTHALLTVLLLAFGFSSCNLFRAHHPEQWQKTTIMTPNQKVLFEGLVLALRKEDFKVGSGADAGAHRVVSGWRNHASPFKGRSYRERAIVLYEPQEDGGFLVRVRVERELNQSIRPLLPGSAKWERAPDQPEVSKRILQYVHSYLGGEWAPIEVAE
ncbi:MAG: hypothetical protein P1V35_06010 [Planctomycetota bacterium]|nr:hypothetical protein [Planctomycetota bacterium]